MNAWLPRVVIGLSLALCVLCTVQWVRESRLTGQVQSLEHAAHDSARQIGQLTSERERAWATVQQVEARQTQAQAAASSNQLELARLQRQVQHLEAVRTNLTRQLEIHQAALATANRSLAQQNEAIRKQNQTVTEQNENLKRLVSERDHLIERLNQRTKEYNEVAEKYQKLGERLEAELKARNP